MRARITLGTRGSPLARWQAEHVAGLIRARHPDCEVALHVIVTSGDRFSAAALSGPPDAAPGATPGKEVWVKEIEEALLAGAIDLAVHSLKDVPAVLPEGLVLAGFPRRADPRDALVSRTGLGLAALPEGARVGTTSIRRVCQLRAHRPDLQVVALRGNVETRLRRVEEGVVEAALLACAGLDRLGLGARICERLPPEVMLPAVGQGVLALESRAGDAELRELGRALSDDDTTLAVQAERALLGALGGSCRTPLAAHARRVADHLLLEALVGQATGPALVRATGQAEATPEGASALGRRVADELLAKGAGPLLAGL